MDRLIGYLLFEIKEPHHLWRKIHFFERKEVILT